MGYGSAEMPNTQKYEMVNSMAEMIYPTVRRLTMSSGWLRPRTTNLVWSVSGKRRISKSSRRSIKSTILATSCGYQETSAMINPIAPLQPVSRELRESKKQGFMYRFVRSFSCVQSMSTSIMYSSNAWSNEANSSYATEAFF